MMKINAKKYLGYSDIFDGQSDTIEDYLSGIDKETMFALIPFLINASRPDHQYHYPLQLLPRWFSQQNEDFCMSVLVRFDRSSIFLNPISSLRLVEIVYNHQFEETRTKTDSEIEIDIFKVYSLLNQEQNELEVANMSILPKTEDPEHRNALFIQYTFHTSDLINVDVLRILCCQIYKATEFLKYVSTEHQLEEHYKLFLERYECQDWKEYLLKLYALVIPALVNDNDNSFHQANVTEGKDFEAHCNFLEQFVLTEEEDYELKDFIALRTNPLIKIEKGKYRVISKLFLVEKIFKSLTFLFSLDINKRVSPENKIKDFRGQHTQNFSENTILYNVLGKAFPDKWLKLSGEEFKEAGYDKGEPDYYLRFKNKILLFESKDVIIKGSIKQSKDHRKIVKALREKFCKVEGNGRGVGIHQLINNIKRIHSKYYSDCDTDYKIENIRIYPILLVHDRQFDSMAFNKILNEWFQIELEKIKDEIDISKVQKLTLINIDTIIYYEQLFESGQILLDQVISKYHEFSNRLIPFSLYAKNYLDKKMINAPKFLEKMVNELKK